MNLYEKHVPKDCADIFGQRDVVAQMRDIKKKLLKGEGVSQCYVFSGPYGCGKSAMAKILADILGCEPVLYNSANANGVDFGRRFASEILPYKAMTGQGRAFIIEEAHKMTAEAQECLLVPLEKEIPHGSAVIFTTTEPDKVRRFIGSGRARHFEVKPIPGDDLLALLAKVSAAEGFAVGEDILERIAHGSGGSARMALTNLEKVAAMPAADRDGWRPPDAEDGEGTVNAMLLRDALSASQKANGFNAGWAPVADALRKIKDDRDEPEGVRRFLMGTYAGRLVSPKCGTTRREDLFALAVLEDAHYYDSGFPGLVKDCAEIVREYAKPKPQ